MISIAEPWPPASPNAAVMAPWAEARRVTRKFAGGVVCILRIWNSEPARLVDEYFGKGV